MVTAFSGRELRAAAPKGHLRRRREPSRTAMRLRSLGQMVQCQYMKGVSKADIRSDISCTSDSITLHRTNSLYRSALDKVHNLVGGYIITSHASCNDKHERTVYRVLYVIDMSKDSVTLRGVRTQWQSPFDFIKIDLVYTTEPLELQEHKPRGRSLQLRQTIRGAAILASAPAGLAQSAPAAVDTAAPTSTRINLATTINNKVLPLPTNSPLEIKCIKCSMEASTYEFRIPGVGSAAVLYGPFLAAGYNYTGTLSLTEYGLDMAVPEGAQASFSINTDNDDAVKATQTQCQFHFQDALFDDIISQNFLDDINLRAGRYIDTPIINATAKQISGVKSDCSSGGDLQNMLNVDFSRSWNFGAYASGFAQSYAKKNDANSKYNGGLTALLVATVASLALL
ncbi:hypothetical protein EK21DRAFT_90861 [Setomelanomma holmii]|uniref:DUF7029 domain-containing protein n=1 Tax=Setomelanomma holmii TaxID=210430 RepID=A0A9P4H5Q9_9PLEO|nr:hypothetical protein EK21DRAFT_90861 [Setomelanomma holmii]